jgi:hypothetical protein
MLDGSDRGLVTKLWELPDAWGFGGGLWLAKEHPMVKLGAMGPSDKDEFLTLNSSCRFEATPFHLAGSGARGHAIWFQTGPRDEGSSSMHNRMLCGWVTPDRAEDLAQWLHFLNELVTAHVAKLKAQWDALTEEEKQDALSAAHLEASFRAFERMGIPMPRGNRDDKDRAR